MKMAPSDQLPASSFGSESSRLPVARQEKLVTSQRDVGTPFMASAVLSTRYPALRIRQRLSAISRQLLTLCVLCVLAVQVFSVFAQEPAATPEPMDSTAPVDTSAVSDDAVFEVAESLYCPVCENIPLDSCPTEACRQWREEIRIQLAQGQTPQQVINNFVERYGDRVVGVPQDPLLRGLSLITPWLIGAVVLVAGVSILIRWRRGQRGTLATTTGTVSALDDEASYRARLESDLIKRR